MLLSFEFIALIVTWLVIIPLLIIFPPTKVLWLRQNIQHQQNSRRVKNAVLQESYSSQQQPQQQQKTDSSSTSTKQQQQKSSSGNNNTTSEMKNRRKSNAASSSSVVNTKKIYNIPQNKQTILVFVNPKSGGRLGNDLLQLMREILSPNQVFDLTEKGIDVKEIISSFCSKTSSSKNTSSTSGTNNSKSFSTTSNNSNNSNIRILICGGDGSIGWVSSSCLAVGQKFPIAILPLGTGNDLARTLGWGRGCTTADVTKENLTDILASVLDARIQMLDHWTVEIDEDVEEELKTFRRQKRKAAKKLKKFEEQGGTLSSFENTEVFSVDEHQQQQKQLADFYQASRTFNNNNNNNDNDDSDFDNDSDSDDSDDENKVRNSSFNSSTNSSTKSTAPHGVSPTISADDVDFVFGHKAKAENLDVDDIKESQEKLTGDDNNKNKKNKKNKKIISMLNYFSVGIDAEIALRFHAEREQYPEQFTSQAANLVRYARLGFEKSFDSRPLNDRVDLYTSSKNNNSSQQQQLIPVHPHWKCLMISNILYYQRKDMWGGDEPLVQEGDDFRAAKIDDGVLEAFAISGTFHFGIVHCNLDTGLRVAQEKEFDLFLTEPGQAVQCDGEPFVQEKPCRIRIRKAGQYPMLKGSRDVGLVNEIMNKFA